MSKRPGRNRPRAFKAKVALVAVKHKKILAERLRICGPH